MTKSAESYSTSRYNALKFGTHQDGPIRCVGIERCHYRYCDVGDDLPLGGPCPWEAEYARRLEADFRDRYVMLTITPDVDDFDDLVREHVNIYLQRNRAMTRLNRTWDKRTVGRHLNPEAAKEFDLSDLYLDRLTGRERRLQTQLDEGLERMHQRAERLRPHLQAIELFVAGTKAARDATPTATQPDWDDFIDGSKTNTTA